jgi:hypothetical protein
MLNTKRIKNSDPRNLNQASNLMVQSATVLGNFACGVDQGVRAILDAGAFPRLIRLLPAFDVKVNLIN